MTRRTASFRWARRAASAFAVLLVGGCTVVVAGSFLDGQPGGDEAEPGSYQLDYRCDVTDGVMTVRGEISNGVLEDRALRIRVWAVRAQEGRHQPAVSEYVDLGPRETVRFERAIVDAEAIANDVRLGDGDTCGATVYES